VVKRCSKEVQGCYGVLHVVIIIIVLAKWSHTHTHEKQQERGRGISGQKTPKDCYM